ncbi:penicillin-binding protein 1C [Chitinophaga terrae (ex Kim and Jung 2007)]|uniref:penicillin-binding protein 1C n=1 Tax=Chitinophaga terrae (ex Kim and Jung 2007) TaxID=408074 RepID=UPI00277EA668|nr:penicillin-binding protein 1C [Chitinophaga terrae (ex Kim and Jung 2007)]MDQ0105287.1 penicillin-binding protein 1C [Chitinophaga terrae (ex Kim and Jung 2007)]
MLINQFREGFPELATKSKHPAMMQLESIKQWCKKRKWLLAILAILLVAYYFCLPKKLFNTPTSYVLEDANGDLLNAGIASDGQWRFPFNEHVPEKFEKCIIAYEDKRFRYHWGLDPIAIVRALKQNIQGKKVMSGGSTITMQVIRLSRNQPRNIWQKIIEGVLATRLEFAASKKKILALYASNAPFGGNVIGLEAAAWRYYGRKADLLSWGEMAALAVLPNNPAMVHPGRNRQTLLAKRNRLLDKLCSQKTIDSLTCQLSKLEPLPDQPLALPQDAPHLMDLFHKQIRKGEPTRLRSTVIASLQRSASAIVERFHSSYKANGINNAAVLVLDVETGNTLAYVGNIYHPADSELESHVDIIQSRRSPGSTLKPVLYAAMLNDGLILPHTLIPDIPTQIAGYAPQNFDLGFDGAVPASRALARSLNIPAVRMLQQYRYERFYTLLKKLGITTLDKPADHYGLSLILGGAETTLWEMCGMYASMARTLVHIQQYNGKYDLDDIHPPNYRHDAEQPDEHELSNAGVLDAGSLWYAFEAMTEGMRPGEELLWQQFSSSQRIAWKTGTSFGFRDGWAIGVTPQYVVGVWVGNADGEGRPGLIGVSTAAPILFDVFRQLKTGSWFVPPYAQLRKVEVCAKSGYRASELCDDVDTLMVPAAGIRAGVCPFHQLVHLDRTGHYRVTEACESPQFMQHKSWFILPPSQEFYYRNKNTYLPLPPYKPECLPYVGLDKAPMELIYPRPNARIYIPIEIDGQPGQTIFTATHRNTSMKIFWHLDNKFMGATTEFHQMAFHPLPGRHIITLVDENGERIEQSFEILNKEKD